MSRMQGLNLLPASCLDARARVRRQWHWSVASVGLGAVLCAGWVAHLGGQRSRSELLQSLAVLQARQTELDLQLTRASRSRAALYDEARALSQLRPESAVPEQLLELARVTPDGVFLTELRALPFAPAKNAPRPTAAPAVAADGAKPASIAGSSPQTRPPARGLRSVQIAGVAADFERVQRFVDSLTRVPRWQRVELVRSVREKRDSREVVSFRVECQDPEGGP
jgi:Tfp pilus assembly protein PilN